MKTLFAWFMFVIVMAGGFISSIAVCVWLNLRAEIALSIAIPAVLGAAIAVKRGIEGRPRSDIEDML